MKPHLLPLLAADGFGTAMLVLSLVLLLAFVIGFAVFIRYLGLWIQSRMTGAEISLAQLVLMSLRKVNPSVIVHSKIMAVQSGITSKYPISAQALQAHYLAGGDVPNVIRALIAAYRAHIDIDWQTAQAIDLAGRDLLDAVRTSVNPKVIDCPDPAKSRGPLEAMAGDGIQVMVRARVTVRSNLKQLVGGATEETIIARVGQGIVQAIGLTASYKTVLENPESISKLVLAQGLEAQTAFEIVSIDIADIDVGKNIGARLQAEQAEADMRVAEAKAEEQRAQAMARQQEMQAEVQENRAKLVLAEAEIPLGIAASMGAKRMGLLDYFDLQNLNADTEMRANIAGEGSDRDRSQSR
jgi:uncharacterized protein YqfA (UPF0365 family)